MVITPKISGVAYVDVSNMLMKICWNDGDFMFVRTGPPNFPYELSDKQRIETIEYLAKKRITELRRLKLERILNE